MKLCLITFAAACALGQAAFAGGHATPSTFQNTCSTIQFAYQQNDAMVFATCLTEAGTPNATTIPIPGISNQNGTLTQGEGSSTFQQSCGNITIDAEINNVILYANCRTEAGTFNETSIELFGINNNNGNLSM